MSPRLDRRAFVRRTLGLGAALAAPWPALRAQAPAIVTAAGRLPQITHGVAAGDVHGGRAIVWSRADRAARLFVDYATTESFRDARRVPGPAALDASDFTARAVLTGLPAGQRIFYRVTFQSLSDLRDVSQPVTGSFTTPPAASATGRGRPVTIAFTEFDPFWEFVAGPLNAGTFGPNPLDATFGPEQRFLGIPAGMKPNRPPSAGLQFYGLFTIDPGTQVLTATLHDLSGRAIYRVERPPTR